MRSHLVLRLALVLTFCFSVPTLHAASPGVSQTDYERSVESVVRNKYFYKSGKIEAGLTGGVMPYDSLVNHYMVGGKGTWHLSDHYGWEIIDAQLAFPSLTSYTSDLVKAKGITNLQTSKLNMILTSNFLLSPVYGKIRFFGSQVLYFDLYTVLGLGFAKTETLKLTTTGTTSVPTQSIMRSGFEPAFDFGIGFKIFVNNAFGILLDFRDYVTYTEVYGKKALKSNFSVFAGVSFFLPNF